MRDAGRRAAIWARDAAGIQEAHAADHLVARHVRVAMQENVRTSRRHFRRDVDQVEADAVSLQMFGERPRAFAIAISADDDYWRAKVAHALQKVRRTNVAEVPDFIHACRELGKLRREVIMRVREDEDAERLAHARRLVAAGACGVPGGTLRTFRPEKPRQEPQSETHRQQSEKKTEHR